jgi:hypothetical protein
MGKWAQQRKRGSPGCGAAPLQTPPAPSLTFEDDTLLQTAGINQTSLGSCYLYYSPDGISPYGQVAEREWDPVVFWTPYDQTGPGYYVTQQSGDGISYAAQLSPNSNAFLVS